MKKNILLILFIHCASFCFCQSKATQIFELVKKISNVEILADGWYAIDSLDMTDFNPLRGSKTKGYQILRTYGDKADNGYMVGVHFFGSSGKDTIRSLDIAAFQRQGKVVEELVSQKFLVISSVYNNADRFAEYKGVDSQFLKKMNADFGIIYQLKMDKLFQNKYKKCKVLAFTNFKLGGAYIFYFYNDDDQRIVERIFSQIGRVRFTQE